MFQSDSTKLGLVIILGALLIASLFIYSGVSYTNSMHEEDCNTLSSVGYDSHITSYQLLFGTGKDCYVMVNDSWVLVNKDLMNSLITKKVN